MATGVDHAYLWRIERGLKRGFGQPKLGRLAKALGCDVGVLLLAAELDDGITVRVEQLPEVARVFLRKLARGVRWKAPFWEDFEGFLRRYELYEIDTQEEP
jgi:transcriptional regulator with XRE-family HTH domain